MSNNKSVPAYLSLVLELIATAESLGLAVDRDPGTVSTVPENRGYCFVRIGGGSAALIIPKQTDKVMWCDSHIDWSGEKGYVPLPKPNGKVICRINPAEADLGSFLQALAGASVRASRRASRAASPEASDAAVTELVARLRASLPGEAAASSTHPVPATEEELGDFSELV